MITVRDDITVEVVLRYLRRLDEMPDHTDQIFVVDRQEHLRGLLSVSRLLVSDLDTRVTSIMTVATVKLAPNENAQDAATAFERYDLVSAPVVDGADKLIGRVTVNSVVDVIREETDSENSRPAACARKKICLRRYGAALKTAGRGWRSTW